MHSTTPLTVFEMLHTDDNKLLVSCRLSFAAASITVARLCLIRSELRISRSSRALDSPRV